MTVDFLYRGVLETPTVSIGDTVLTQETFMELTAGQEYTLNVSEQENAANYQVRVTYGLKSGRETVVTYEGTSNTFTMPDDVRYMRVYAYARTPGWKTGETDELRVRIGTLADSFVSVTVNGEEWQENMTVRSLEETVFSWNYITNATYYTVEFAFNEPQGNTWTHSMSDARCTARFSLNPDCVYFRVSAYDVGGGTLLSSTPFMRLGVDHTPPEASFTLTADRESAYIDESIQFTMERQARLFRVAAYDMYPAEIYGYTTSATSSWSAVGDVTYFAVDEAGNFSNIVTVHYDSKGALPAPQLYMNDQPYDYAMVFEPGKTYTWRAVCEADGLTDPVSYRFSIRYFDKNGQHISSEEINEAEITTSVPEAADCCNMSVYCSAPGWQQSSIGYNMPCGVASSTFESVLVNGEEWHENMTVHSLERTAFSWNYITNATIYWIDLAFNETQHADASAGLGDASYNAQFSLNADYVYFRVRAYDTEGGTLLSSTPFMRLSIDRTLPEASFALTADRDSAYIGEPIQLTTERPAQFCRVTANDMFVNYIGYGTTSVTDMWNVVGDVTYYAVDDAGNYSNFVTVHYDSKGTLPEPQLYVNDQPYDRTTVFEPGKTYTLRAACVADGLTDPVSYRVYISYEDKNGQFISSDESNEAEITTSVPLEADRCYVNIYCTAVGWEEHNRGFNLPCGVTSSTFDSVLVNGEPYTQGMTVAPFDEVRISWNYITGAANYNIQISDPQGHTMGYGYGSTNRDMDIMIDDQREWVDVAITAIAENGSSLCKSTLRLQVGGAAPEPAFTLTANAQEIYTGESIHFSADRPITLYQTGSSRPIMLDVLRYATEGNCTIGQAGTYTFVAVDSESNSSNIVTVTAKTKGKLPSPKGTDRRGKP